MGRDLPGVLAEHAARLKKKKKKVLLEHIFGFWGAWSGLKGSEMEIFHQNGKWGGEHHKPCRGLTY